MANKKTNPTEKRPEYLSEDGTIDLAKIWTFQPKQTELLRDFDINGHTYRAYVAPQILLVGGARAGKTTGAFMHGVINYCLAFAKCDILVLRRTFKELEAGVITDMRTFIPKELYDYDQQRHIATFGNGSRIIFGHCQTSKERDIRQYLGQAYCYILVDECAEFSAEAWNTLNTRNAVNAGCEPDEHGNLPIPRQVGCTNPVGVHWTFYHTTWVKKEPWEKSGTERKDINGNWFEIEEGKEPYCVYNTADFKYSLTTAMDNPIFLQRNPGWLAMMQAKPKAIRDKYLFGLLDKTEGQYFDCWSNMDHVINLREDPDTIMWQEWQPVWIGNDWGQVHANTSYFFTRALVKSPLTDRYSMKTVCFREVVVTGGKTHKTVAKALSQAAKYPDGKPCKVSAIYFSHEKFNRQGSEHTPAEEYSRELKPYGLPAVTRGTQDRVSSASFMYNELANGRLVFLDYCTEIINAIPGLQRDPKNLEDVLKTNATSDDAYDGCRLGLWGQLGTKQRPVRDCIQEHATTLDPLARHFYMMEKNKLLKKSTECWQESKEPYLGERNGY